MGADETAATPSKPLSKPPSKPASKSELLSVELSGSDLQFFRESERLGRSMVSVSERLEKVSGSPQMKVLVSEILQREREIGNELSQLCRESGLPAARPSPKASPDPFKNLQGPRLEKALVESLVQTSAERLRLLETHQESSNRAIRRFSVRHSPEVRDRHRRLARLVGVLER